MGWGNSTNVVTTNLDAGTDSPATARSDIKTSLDELKNVIDGRGTADGCASLDATGRMPFAQHQYGTGTTFPSITDEAYGFQFYRSDLGEWFTLMNATVWGGTGKAWVANTAEAWAFGDNYTSAVVETRQLSTYGKAGPVSATVGLHIDVDMLIVSASFSNDVSITGTVDLEVSSSSVLSVTLSAVLKAAMTRAVTNWVRLTAGDIMSGTLTLTAGNMDDPTFYGTMRRVIDA